MPYENELDLVQDSAFNLTINKQRTLNVNVTAYYISGDTEVDFDFSSYTGAFLQVRTKPDAPFVILSFNTSDASITLPATGGTFNLYKTAEELAVVRAGEYRYDMYLISPTYPKRAFLSGLFTINSIITT